MKTSLAQIYKDLYLSSISNSEDHDWLNCDKGSRHSYIDEYERIFAKLRDKPVRILEIGIQSGVCALMWNEYFDQAEITGVDIIDEHLQQKYINALHLESNLKFILHDATEPSIATTLTGKYDIIIDDGTHKIQDQIKTYMILKDFLTSDGIYIIEDVQKIEDAFLLTKLISHSRVVDFRHMKNRHDDIMVIAGA